MPEIVAPTAQDFTSYLPPWEKSVDDTPSMGEGFSAGFASENDVINLLEFNRRKTFPQNLNYDLVKSLKERELWPDRDLYIGSFSDEEVEARRLRIAQQRLRVSTAERSGWAGYAGMIAGGFVSPTSAIPLIRGMTVARTAAKTALAVGTSVAAQEAVLFANQETRTREQAIFSIAASTILGGILGAAGHALSKSQMDKMADDMANPPREPTISEPMGELGDPSSFSAYQVVGEGGKLKSNKYNKPVLDTLSRAGPVTRLIQQSNAPEHMPNGSPLAREIGGKLSQAGLRLEGNREGFSASPGGNVENINKGYVGALNQTTEKLKQTYKDYVYKGDIPKFFPMTRAMLGAQFSNDTMLYSAYKTEVFLALANKNQHPNSLIAKAATEIKAHIDELYEEGVKVGTFTGKEQPKGDLSYIWHIWDNMKVKADTNGLVKVLADHFQTKKLDDFNKELSKAQEKQSKAGTFIEDIERPEDQVAEYIQKFREELQANEDSLPFEVAQLQLEAKNLREKARKLEGKDKSDALALARDSEARAGPELAEHRKKQATIRARLANLSTARVSVNKRFEAKLSKIERNEELQLETMLRGSKQAQKLLALISKGTDKEVEEALSKFKSMFAQTAEAFDNAEEQIVRLTNQQDQSLQGVLDKQEARMDRLDDLAEKIDEIDSFDRAALKAEVEDAAKEMLEVHANINARRAVRNERLKAAAQKLTPEEYQAKIDARKAAASKIIPDFVERQRVAGANSMDLEKGTADFSEYVNTAAWETVNKIMGTDRRLVYSDIVQDKRGVEITRVLDIPADKVIKWLNTDIQDGLNIYTRTVGADNTLARVFGNADMSGVMAKLTDEQNRAIAAIETAKDKKGVPLTEEAQSALNKKTVAFYEQLRKDIFTLQERTRGVRGIGRDPDSAGQRLGRIALWLNNLRYMGSAVLASIADPARIVQRYGLLQVYRSALIPFITQFKDLQISAREGFLAGTMAELTNHSRQNALTNVFEDAHRGNKLEQGLEFMSSRMGLVSGLNLWTHAWQTFTAATANAKLIDSIGLVMGEKGTAKEIKDATEYLASVNITPDIAETIWRTQDTGGIEKIGKVWLPNTELWDISQPHIKDARRAYRAALAGEIDDTIIKPGFEAPSFKDANMGARLFTQFKSFALSSTQKTVMAGLQQGDAAYIHGMMISLAMGALSYYLYAVAAGGKTYETMMNSIEEGNWELWADEMITRSGQTGIFDSVQRFANKVPLINDYTSFSGGANTKSLGSGSLEDELGGPTLDLLTKLGKVLQSADPNEPNYGLTRHELHLARQLLPYQNLFYIRRLLSKIENASGDAFGLEGRRQ